MLDQTGEVIRGTLPADLLARLQAEPPVGPAVYFLFRGDVCVYIGASATPANRVASHRECGRPFDRTLYLPVSNEELADTERRWIGTICPANNQRGNPAAGSEKGWGDRLRKDRDLVPGFGERLRLLREAAGMTQPALAAASGTHYTNVARLEAEARSPSLRLAVALAAALGVSVADLVPDRPPAPDRRKLLTAISSPPASPPAPKKGKPPK